MKLLFFGCLPGVSDAYNGMSDVVNCIVNRELIILVYISVSFFVLKLSGLIGSDIYKKSQLFNENFLIEVINLNVDGNILT